MPVEAHPSTHQVPHRKQHAGQPCLRVPTVGVDDITRYETRDSWLRGRMQDAFCPDVRRVVTGRQNSKDCMERGRRKNSFRLERMCWRNKSPQIPCTERIQDTTFGIWLGMRNNRAECFIGTADGVFRAREVRRLEHCDWSSLENDPRQMDSGQTEKFEKTRFLCLRCRSKIARIREGKNHQARH